MKEYRPITGDELESALFNDPVGVAMFVNDLPRTNYYMFGNKNKSVGIKSIKTGKN